MSSVSEEELRRRVAAGSSKLDDYVDLADRLASDGHLDEAIETMERTLGLPLTPFDLARSWTELGWRLYDGVADGVPRAQLLAQDAIAGLTEEPERPPVLAVRGAAQSLLAHCLAWSDRDAAVDLARQAIRALELGGREAPAFPWMRWLHYDAARAYILLEDGEGADACCRRFLDTELEDGERLYGLAIRAEALRLAGRLAEAEQVVDEALNLVHHRTYLLPYLHHVRGLIQRAAGHPREACESFERVVAARAAATRPSAPEFYMAAHFNLGELYYEAGEYARGAEAFREFLARSPNNDPGRVAGLFWLGQCHVGRGDDVEARSTFRAVLEVRGVSDEDRRRAEQEVACYSARLAYSAGDHETAAGLLESLLDSQREDDDDRHWALNLMGHCHYSLGRYDAALACYLEVLRSPRASHERRATAAEWADWSVGRLRFDSGALAEAAEAFARLVDRYPPEHAARCVALLWLGVSYESMTAAQAARDCFAQVLSSPRATEDDRTRARAGLTRLA